MVLAVQLVGKSQDALSAYAFEDCIITHTSLWSAGTQLARSASSPLATGGTGICFLHFLLSSLTWPSIHHKFLLLMIHAYTFSILSLDSSLSVSLTEALLHHPVYPLHPWDPKASITTPQLPCTLTPCHCCQDSRQQMLKPRRLCSVHSSRVS